MGLKRILYESSAILCLRMETRIRDVLDDYERNTYLTIRSSYDNMVKEISDAVNNVLTMTSFDFENSIKQGLIKVRNELRKAELLPKDAELAKIDNKISDQSKNNRNKPKKEARETYEKIFIEEDYDFDSRTNHQISSKPEARNPIIEKSTVQAPQITSSKNHSSNKYNNKTGQDSK